MTEAGGEAAVVELGARVHLFVQPRAREEFTSLFRDVLGCDVRERDFGLAYPILLVSFGNGSASASSSPSLLPRSASAKLSSMSRPSVARGSNSEPLTSTVICRSYAVLGSASFDTRAAVTRTSVRLVGRYSDCSMSHMLALS